jgi:LysR family glycine cleavage system transcriptional activator
MKRYKLLHSPYEPWTAWLLEGGAGDVWPSTGPAFDDAIAIVRAAEAGQGLALARWSLVGDEVAKGRLAVAGRAVRSPQAYYFVCPPANVTLDKVAVFQEWLTGECERYPGPPSL